jgi:hypothetical protein
MTPAESHVYSKQYNELQLTPEGSHVFKNGSGLFPAKVSPKGSMTQFLEHPYLKSKTLKINPLNLTSHLSPLTSHLSPLTSLLLSHLFSFVFYLSLFILLLLYSDISGNKNSSI